MNKELVKRISSSLILIVFLLFFLLSEPYLKIFLIILCFFVACYEWSKMSKSSSNKIFGFIFLLFSFYTFYHLSLELILLIFVISICISTDIGGYIFGKIFKGPKLTSISPNKTYSGMIGGYLLSLMCLSIITNFIDYAVAPFQLFLITIFLSTVSQIGDITISFFKRKAEIKNTGNLIPGHGGLLDRIDGMIFAVPTIFIIELTGFLNI